VCVRVCEGGGGGVVLWVVVIVKHEHRGDPWQHCALQQLDSGRGVGAVTVGLEHDHRQLSTALKVVPNVPGVVVFVNAKVSVNIACKHEGAAEGGRARGTRRTAYVAFSGSVCATFALDKLVIRAKSIVSQFRRCK
jgi:hypothetical protein